MKINIRNVHFPVDDKTRNYAVEKIGKLEKYYKNIIMASLVFEKHAGDTANVRYCFSAELDVPGENIRVEECGRNILVVIDNVENKLRERLLKEKSKRNPSRLHHAKKFINNFFGK